MLMCGLLWPSQRCWAPCHPRPLHLLQLCPDAALPCPATQVITYSVVRSAIAEAIQEKLKEWGMPAALAMQVQRNFVIVTPIVVTSSVSVTFFLGTVDPLTE